MPRYARYMRAILCKEFGPPSLLTLEEVADPVPGRGEVVVDVAAASVNYPDTLTIRDMYQFKPPLPFSPGGEFAGTVSALGDGVESVAVGDRVIAIQVAGGFAEKALVDQPETLIPIPDDMDFTSAASWVMAYATSYYALKDRAAAKEGETLLVLGAAGGVGLAAVDLGEAMGMRVIAAASSDDKLAVCREYGAAATINYADESVRDRVKDLTVGQGADVVIDPVGGSYSEAALRSLAWQGRLMVIGFAAGDIPAIPLNLTLLKGCDVRGVFWGAHTFREPDLHRQNLMELFEMYHGGVIRPHISARYPLAQAPQAIADLLERRATGKVVVEVV
jgi:NADPH2:quinone reductase